MYFYISIATVPYRGSGKQKAFFPFLDTYYGGENGKSISTLPAVDSSPLLKWANCLMTFANGPYRSNLHYLSIPCPEIHVTHSWWGHLFVDNQKAKHAYVFLYNFLRSWLFHLHPRDILFLRAQKGQEGYPKNQVSLFHRMHSSINITLHKPEMYILYWLFYEQHGWLSITSPDSNILAII